MGFRRIKPNMVQCSDLRLKGSPHDSQMLEVNLLGGESKGHAFLFFFSFILSTLEMSDPKVNLRRC